MNWFKSLNDALEYIEEHIREDIDYDEIARIACCSRYHFLRTFGMITDMNLSEYIRLRRLTLASNDLIATKDKIIDIAMNYGYETPESFTKAFKRFHGVSPSTVRKERITLKAVPPLSFQITIKGEKRMDYRIERKDAFNVVGFARDVTTKNEENYTTIPAFWKEVQEDGSYYNLVEDADKSYGISYEYDENLELLKYMIAIDGKESDISNTETLFIPESTWAVFKSVGPMPTAIQKVWKQIYQEWFPATQYQHAQTPELEVYYHGDPSSADYVCEVWIPVKEK